LRSIASSLNSRFLNSRNQLQRMHVVELASPVFERVHGLLGRHPLRASDALHLASALLLGRRSPREVQFVVYDEKLADAARAEGLDVLP
jgi:uncharacterized protein